MGSYRIGQGYDVHRFGGDPPMVLGGVVVSEERGIIGTSDADVAVHALIDALLGAAGLGDIGEMFPSSETSWQGAVSLDLLANVVDRLTQHGYAVGNVDITIVCETVRIAPYRDAMRSAISEVLSVSSSVVSVKATTTDGLGTIGRDEGVAAHAVALIYGDV
jgi:2-C-methyl-D-erythritol 2,4-cyclodiphosphate synthase